MSRRLPQLALLGVLGLSARERLALVLGRVGVHRPAGSVLGLALARPLAALALRLLAGDLAAPIFGITPACSSARRPPWCTARGVIVAVAGGWLLPARIAQRIAPAQALLAWAARRSRQSRQCGHGRGRRCCSWGVALTQAHPPIASIQRLAAHVALPFWLAGGIACVPAMLGPMLRWTKLAAQRPLLLLAMHAPATNAAAPPSRWPAWWRAWRWPWR
ncbi:MAG: hypothetical protein IPP50_22300 [Piscinibacter sp.]|nr:hypothetical protein [Piscinibacter sp.]